MRWFGISNARLRYYVCIQSNRHLCDIDDLLTCIKMYSCRMCRDLLWLILVDKKTLVYTITSEGEVRPVGVYTDPMKLENIILIEKAK
jgi:hypothetical protein